jgi:hypothetical protein
VPFSDRPDRDGYTYTTLNANIGKAQLSKMSFNNLPKATPKKSSDFVDEKSRREDEGDVCLTLPEVKKEDKISPRHEKLAKAAIKAAMAQEKKAAKLAASEEKKKRKSQEVRLASSHR